MTGPTLRQLWRDAIRDTDDPLVDVYARAVAFALDRYMSADGRARTGTRRLARLAGATTDTVTDRIARLEDLGWLTVERPTGRRGATNRYRAAIPPEVSDPAGQPTTQGQEVSDRAGQPTTDRIRVSDPVGRGLIGPANGPDSLRLSDPTGRSVRPHRSKCPTPPVEVSDPVGRIPGGFRKDPTRIPAGVPASAEATAGPPRRAGVDEGAAVVRSLELFEAAGCDGADADEIAADTGLNKVQVVRTLRILSDRGQVTCSRHTDGRTRYEIRSRRP